jgi:hypothetical protein
MSENLLQYRGNGYHRRRVVCITVVPPYDQPQYAVEDRAEAKVIRLIDGLGPNCRVSKFQWLVATDEPCGAILQDLSHEGVDNVLVFSVLIANDWKFWCKPRNETDEWEFDGLAAFLQQQLADPSPTDSPGAEQQLPSYPSTCVDVLPALRLRYPDMIDPRVRAATVVHQDGECFLDVSRYVSEETGTSDQFIERHDLQSWFTENAAIFDPQGSVCETAHRLLEDVDSECLAAQTSLFRDEVEASIIHRLAGSATTETADDVLVQAAERERRIRQFEHYFSMLEHRTLRLVKSDCFLVFSVRAPRSVRPRIGGSKVRIVQFAFMKDGFYLDLPDTTLALDEAKRLVAERAGFEFALDRPQKRLGERQFDPVQRIYSYAEQRTAAEDTAYVLFDLWQTPVDAWIKVEASAFEVTRSWEPGILMG